MNSVKSRICCPIDRVALIGARACALVSVLSAALGVLLSRLAPALDLPLLSTLCLAGISFAIVLYLAVFVMTLSSQTMSLVAFLVLCGSGVLAASSSLLGLHLSKPACVVLGLSAIVLGLALAG